MAKEQQTVEEKLAELQEEINRLIELREGLKRGDYAVSEDK
jgi:hypothetical protein